MKHDRCMAYPFHIGTPRGELDRGKMEHDRGKPCHYYIRNEYLVALGCIFLELTNIITVLLLLAAICPSRNMVETRDPAWRAGNAPVLFSRLSRLAYQPCFLTNDTHRSIVVTGLAPVMLQLALLCPSPLSCFGLPLSCCPSCLRHVSACP